MVGLPATGKSFISRSLARYLRWLGYETKIFSAALYRQQMIGTSIDAEFFNTDRPDCLKSRTVVADAALNDMIAYLKQDQDRAHECDSHACSYFERVAIMDAANTIKDRRQIIADGLKSNHLPYLFIECVYESEALLNEHLQFLHLLSPDYANMTPEQAAKDYRQRMGYYKKDYEQLQLEESWPVIRMINGGERLELGSVTGFLPCKIVLFLMNLLCQRRKIFLKIQSQQTETQLHEEVAQLMESEQELQIWIGPDVAFPAALAASVKSELAGISSFPEIEHLPDDAKEAVLAAQFPEDFALYQQHPYNFRFPRSESYADLARRLQPSILQLEGSSASAVLIVADISVIRCVYSYYVESSDANKIPRLKLNSDEIIELEPLAYGCFESRWKDGVRVKEKVFRAYLDEPPANHTSPKLIAKDNK